MPTKVTYYAIVDGYSTRDEPGGVLRRVEDEKAEYDEPFGSALNGHGLASLFLRTRQPRQPPL